MDRQERIALFFCKAARAEIGEPFKVELIPGLGKGAGLRGAVGWGGDRWHVMIDRNVSDWQLWCNLWHEAAHVANGDTQKATSGLGDADRALVLTGKTPLTAGVFDGYVQRSDAVKEAQADGWAWMQARAWLDSLNDHLATLPADSVAAGKAIGAKHCLDAGAAKRYTKVIHFETPTKAAAVLPPEYLAWLKATFPNGWPAWVEATMIRHARYCSWLADLRAQGLVPERA